MARMTARLAVAGAVLAASALTACSGSGSSGTLPSSASASSSTSPSGGDGATVQGSARSSGDADQRLTMPVITPTSVGDIAYRPASAADRALFAPALRASGGLLVASSVYALSVSGQDVGSVAFYTTKAGLSQSPTFQDQYVVQLINALAGTASPPRFVRVKGQPIALSTGPAAVAGWIDGDHVVLVHRQGRTPELAALAAGVRSTAPPARTATATATARN